MNPGLFLGSNLYKPVINDRFDLKGRLRQTRGYNYRFEICRFEIRQVIIITFLDLCVKKLKLGFKQCVLV